MKTSYIPLGVRLNSETPRHLIGKEETPYCQNVILDNGYILKRWGISQIHDFGTDYSILGYRRINSGYALIAVGKDGTANSGLIYRWNLNADPTATDYEMLDLTAQEDLSFDDDETFRFTNHYDDNIGLSTIMTNGVTPIYYYPHETADRYPNGTTLVKLITSGTTFQAKYLASFYDALYLANVTSDTNENADPYAVVWSQIGDATDFSVTQYYQQRPEDGQAITGLHKEGDALILGKGGTDFNNQSWSIAPYANFQRISTRYGFTNQEGIMSAKQGMLFNDKGRIMNLRGDWVSYPIHTIFASSDPGDWAVTSADDTYRERSLFAIGRNLFSYSAINSSWEWYQFARKIQVLENTAPGGPVTGWVGDISKHTEMSVGEEDVMTDYLIAYNGRYLCRMNHFNSDLDKNITMVYETKWDSLGDESVNKRIQQIFIQGKGGPFTVKVACTDYPDKTPSFTEGYTTGSQTLTLDSRGYGTVWIEKPTRGRWLALRFEETSTSSAEIHKIGVRFAPHSYK